MKKSNVTCLAILVFCMTLALPHQTIAQDLSGTYRIQVKASKRFLHENGLDDKLISTRHQVEDDYTRFILEREPDGSYRVKVKANNRYWHVDTSSDRVLSTRWQPTDDHTRFYFEKKGDGYYRIKLKATNRYLHEDGGGDKLVSTRYQPKDNFTKFRLVQEPARPVTVNISPTGPAIGEPFIGQVILFAGNFAPRGWAFCNGQLLAISQNQSLFSILGTTYGGDGRTTFGLPDLRGRTPLHAGNGQGLDSTRLGQMSGNRPVTSDSGSRIKTVPTLGLYYIIALTGTYPSRS